MTSPAYSKTAHAHDSEARQAVRKRCEGYMDRQAQMESARSNFETMWQESYEYIVPRKGDITSESAAGEKRGHDLFDSSAINSNQILSGALHSMLTNQATTFFDLTIDDLDLLEDEEVRIWLQETTVTLHQIINGSNFQTEVHEVYIDLGAIGNAAMYIGEHDDKVVHFSTRSMKEIYVQENNLGIVDVVHRKFKWTAKQIVQEFGEAKVPEPVLKKYKSNSADMFTILHIVESDLNPGARFKFSSCYILCEEKDILSESGFREFPYVVPRWTKTSGEAYGRGPGQEAMPDIKMVNKMMETTIKGAQMTVAPPMAVKDDGVIGRVRITPYGLTTVRMDGTTERPIQRLIDDARIDFGYQAVEDTRKRIRSAFYVDQLMLAEGPQMTATEVNQRTEEKLRLMGPVLGRQHTEFLRPLIERVYAIAMRRGKIKPIPAKLRGKMWDVRYSSLVARAQRMSDGTNLARAMNIATPIINARPESLDNINADRVVKHILDIYGVPQKLLNSTREVDKIRAARAKATEQAAAEEQMAAQADAVSKIGPTAVQASQARAQQQQGR